MDNKKVLPTGGTFLFYVYDTRPFKKEIWQFKSAHYLCTSSLHIAYQERQREMARWSLDNLHAGFKKTAVRCQLHPAEGGTDKSDKSFYNTEIQHIESSSDLRKSFFIVPTCPERPERSRRIEGPNTDWASWAPWSKSKGRKIKLCYNNYISSSKNSSW